MELSALLARLEKPANTASTEPALREAEEQRIRTAWHRAHPVGTGLSTATAAAGFGAALLGPFGWAAAGAVMLGTAFSAAAAKEVGQSLSASYLDDLVAQINRARWQRAGTPEPGWISWFRSLSIWRPLTRA